MEKSKFAIDVYMGRVFTLIMYFVPLLALFAGISFSFFKFGLGKYPDVSTPALLTFVGTNILYCGIGVFFARKSKDKEGNLKPKYVLAGKIVITLIIAIQWNYISYMIPSRDYWAFFALFIFVPVFFLDSKFVLVNIFVIDISMIISWIIRPNELLPDMASDIFIPELLLRCILIVLVSTMMYLITWIIEKLLVKELENIAEYDSLTLLRNRRTLNLLLDQAIETNNKIGKEFCFAMCDIDDFKIVNDTYGHPFGDIVLKNIAKIFILKLGESSRIFRYGGEEICVIMDGNLTNCTEMLDEVRKEIAKTTHTQHKISVEVTISCGITQYRSKMSKEDLIKVSDSNLYYAKSHGKNKVIS